VRGARARESGRLTEVERRATDQAFLQQQAYANSAKLRARASVYAYRDPPGALGPWVLGLVDWPDDARALDVGCGPGLYLALLHEHLPSVRAVGVDLSPGMAAEAARHAPTLTADVARLPLPDDCVDRVLAPHMLYHCADIPAAVGELRRVLRPGGSLVAVTNAQDHLAELWDIYGEVVAPERSLVVDRFDLANGGAPLSDVFEEVRVEHTEGHLLVPDPEPLVDYMASTFHFAGRADDGKLDELRSRFRQIIDANGVFRIRTHSGAFVCR
jgi:SAM-dependent methyltransferase